MNDLEIRLDFLSALFKASLALAALWFLAYASCTQLGPTPEDLFANQCNVACGKKHLEFRVINGNQCECYDWLEENGVR